MDLTQDKINKIQQTKLQFNDEIEIRKQNQIFELSIRLGIPKKKVQEIWNEA